MSIKTTYLTSNLFLLVFIGWLFFPSILGQTTKSFEHQNIQSTQIKEEQHFPHSNKTLSNKLESNQTLSHPSHIDLPHSQQEYKSHNKSHRARKNNNETSDNLLQINQHLNDGAIDFRENKIEFMERKEELLKDLSAYQEETVFNTFAQKLNKQDIFPISKNNDEKKNKVEDEKNNIRRKRSIDTNSTNDKGMHFNNNDTTPSTFDSLCWYIDCSNETLLKAYEYSSDYDLMENTTTSTPPSDRSCDAMNSTDHRVITSFAIFLVFSLLFIVFGLMGNGISLLVFSSKGMRKTSSSIYIFHLAISDSIYLLCMFCKKTFTIFKCWNYIHIDYDLSNYSSIGCVLTQYFMDLSADYSSCLILLFTIERYLAVYWPITFKDVCTVRRARWICLIFFVIVAISIAPPHALFISLNSDFQVCTVTEGNNNSFLFAVEMIFYRVMPALMVSILNAFIVYKVVKITNVRTKRNNTSNTTTNIINNDKKHSNLNNTINPNEKLLVTPVENKQVYFSKGVKESSTRGNTHETRIDDQIEINNNGKRRTSFLSRYRKRDKKRSLEIEGVSKGSTPMNCPNTSSLNNKTGDEDKIRNLKIVKKKRKDDRNKQLTITLILVSTTYIAAFLPSLSFYIANWLELFGYIKMEKNTRRLILNYTDLLYISAFANNFFLFTLSGKLFREQIKEIFCRFRMKERRPAIQVRGTADFQS